MISGLGQVEMGKLQEEDEVWAAPGCLEKGLESVGPGPQPCTRVHIHDDLSACPPCSQTSTPPSATCPHIHVCTPHPAVFQQCTPYTPPRAHMHTFTHRCTHKSHGICHTCWARGHPVLHTCPPTQLSSVLRGPDYTCGEGAGVSSPGKPSFHL